ncbi:MAG TPA: cation:proton antiporter regulatory subunit [Pseudonocardiaceae bacterium]|nr:cation:proton antiporter regulatory subunit [Pseudonocardiaceae bacterium]
MDVQVTPLPGIGTLEDFTTRSGHRIGVITHRDGHMELIVSRDGDPEACATSTPLSAEESNTLANLLGAPHLVSRLAEQQRALEGIITSQFPIAPGSPYAGRTLGDTALRTRTAVSVVAVVRQGTVHPSPRPDFVFAPGDMVVMVGTNDGLAQAADILEHG